MIYDKPPATWQELQSMVHQAFVEMGWNSKSPKTVDLVRGQKEVDVWAQEVQDGITTLYFIECKYWDSNIPQQEVHSFRTVVSDGGAHKGLIIAKEGFQKGAFEAAQMSNVDILTWQEFNELFFQRWKKTVTAELVQLAQDALEFSSGPFFRMDDGFKRNWNAKLANGWKEISKITTMVAISATKRVMDELDDGPVQLIRMDFDPNVDDVTEANLFVVFSTHREWYEYIKSWLLQSNEKIEEWYALYESEGGDSVFRSSELVEDE